jgi:hypothetical protein
MPFDTFGAPQFGLNDCKVAPWLATNSYGTAVDVPSVQMMGAILRMLSAELEGDDRITAVAARSIAGQGQFRFGSFNMAVAEVVLGKTSTASGTTPNQQDELRVVGGDNMPYFGLAGLALAEEGEGGIVVFFPKVRITADVTIASMEYGSFTIPEVQVTAVSDASYGILNVIEYETPPTLTIPPPGLTVIA